MKIFVFTSLYLSLVWSLPANQLLLTPRKAEGGRIIRGQVAYAGQYPFIAAIHKSTNEGNYFCGGTLLDSQWVLTAGTCVDSATLFTIQLGLSNLKANEPSTLTLATDEYFLHPEFNPNTLENDIGLIKFRMPITFTDYIRPINYLPNFELLPGTPGVIAMGWGQTSDETADLSDELQFVYLTPWSNEDCKFLYGSQLSEHMVCASGNYNEGFCLGDGGTPLVRVRNGPTYTHMGVASFISQNGCESTDPSGYTRTLDYVEWIRNVTGLEK
jgi:secreted trypsin-like serine protease